MRRAVLLFVAIGASQQAPATARLPDARSCTLATDALGAVPAASSATTVGFQSASGAHLYSAGTGRTGTAGIRAAVQWPRRGDIELDGVDVMLQWYVPYAVVQASLAPRDTVFLAVDGQRRVPIGVPRVPPLRGSAPPAFVPLMTRMPYGEGWRLAQARTATLSFKQHRHTLSASDVAAIDALIRMAICRSTVRSGGG